MAYKQHFIEWFSGKQIPSYWSINNLIGSSTSVMSDSVDGGFAFTALNSANSAHMYDFNLKCQYNPYGSVNISVYKFDQISTGHHYVINGFARVTNNTHSVQGGRQTGSSTFMLRSSDAVTTVMNTSKALDTSYHTHKLTANPSDVKIEIDGTLEATKTTNHPTLSMQPEIFVQVMSNSGNVTQNIRYMECYNT